MTPPPVVYLHIGAPKTGTTFLQQLMQVNKENLAEAGVLFPGSRWGDQVRAVQDLLGASKDPEVRAAAAGAWQRIVDEMLTYDGRASVLSMEWLCFADRARAARAIQSLQSAEVHVVLTVRDTLGTLPAQWQTHAYNQGRRSWQRFTADARKAMRPGLVGAVYRARNGSDFMRNQDIPRMLGIWGRLVPAARLHVVTVPPSGSDPLLLWRRFAEVVGVDPAVCSEPTDQRNASLGQASAELVRRLNVALGTLPPMDYDYTMKEHLALRVLADRARLERRAQLDPASRRLAIGWNRRIGAAIESSGAQVVGDLEDLPTALPPAAESARPKGGGEPTEAELLDAAATAADGMSRVIARRADRLHKRGLEADLDGVDPRIGARLAEGGATTADRWSSSPDPVDAAVTELAVMARVAIDLRRRLRADR